MIQDIILQKKKNIKTSKIPQGNYDMWILNKNTIDVIKLNKSYNLQLNGNLTNITNFIENSFYMVKDSGNLGNECFYYYSSGSTINTNTSLINNKPIPYYLDIIGTSSGVIPKTEIYLVDNDLFDVVNSQLIKSYKSYNCNANFLTKTLTNTSGIFNFDSNDNLSFNSKMMSDNFNIVSYNTKEAIFEGSNEISTNLILKVKNLIPEKKILVPIIIKKYENITIPMIKFNRSNVTYTHSIIPVLTTTLSLSGRTLTSNFEIGKIQSSYKIKAFSEYLQILTNANEYTIILKSGYIIPSITTTSTYSNTIWNLQLEFENSQILVFYFNIVFVNSLELVDNYLGLLTDTTNKIGFPQPVLANLDGEINLVDLLKNYDLLNENIFKANLNNLLLNKLSTSYSIGYKYYENVRNKNTTDYNHVLKPLNFHGILNIKPKLIDVLNQFNSAINAYQEQVVFYIVTYTPTSTYKNIQVQEKKVEVIFNNFQGITRLIELGSSTDIEPNSISISVSYQNPLFVKNRICFYQKTLTQYIITSYDSLYLEANEIIIIDGNFFIIKGLNIFNDTYEAQIINLSRELKYLYNGYYSLGVYYSKENRELADIQPNNIITFNTLQDISIGDFYLQNNQLISSYQSTLINSTNGSLCGKFSEKSLNIKLYCLNNRFYLCDNFIKIKKMDKLTYINNQNVVQMFTVLNIINNEVIFDSTLQLTSGQFYNFILSYLPTKSKYIYIDINGKINSDEKINDNIVIGIQNILSTNKIDLFYVSNNKIIGWNMSASYYWVYLLDINYKKNFINYMKLPKNTNGLVIKDKHSIAIDVIYEKNKSRFKISDSTNFIQGFNWFFGQPVKVNGFYSFIRDIILESGVFYIKVNDDLLFSSLSDSQLSTTIYISCSSSNNKTFYLLNKFRYNYGIQIVDYDMKIGTEIEVIRCALKNDELIFIDSTINNKKIKFKYGVSILENEKANNINGDYQNVYFYKYCMINSDGLISNFDTLIGTYYLHCERDNITIQRIYLSKIKNGNRIKTYSSILFPWNSHTLSKFVSIKLHYSGEFSYNFSQIIQAKNDMEINMREILMLNMYEIKFKNIYQIINNEYYQEIIFINPNKKVNTNIYQKVYLDENLLKEIKIILNNSSYFLVTSNILPNNITKIYTKNTNYLVKSKQTTKNFKKYNLSDSSLDYYINTKILDTEDYVQTINLSKVDENSTKYKYKLLDNTNYIFTTGEKYAINSLTAVVQNIDTNNYTFTTTNPIDVDDVEFSDNFYKIKLLTTVSIDTSSYFDQLLLFKSVKHLKLKLFNNCFIKTINICNYIKPWNKWGLLCSINNTSSLLNLVVSNTCIKWENNVVKIITDPNNSNYSYLTKNEVYRLSKFLESINSNETRKQNYNTLKTSIEPLIFNNLDKLISVPDFFINVVDNINTLLKSFGFNVIFDGNNLIFENDTNPPYITIDGENEIAYDLSNEYTYDPITNSVYRNQNSLSEITNQVTNWINKTTIMQDKELFGVGINKLLRYLNIFGTQLNKLLDEFSNNLDDTPNYYYLNPIKFLVSKIWEKYSTTGNLINLDKEFTDKLLSTVTFNKNNTKIYNYISTDYLLNITYYGLYYYGYYLSLNYNLPIKDENISDLIEYNPYGFVKKEQVNGLIINPVYKYKLNFATSEILPNCTYTLDFLNGDKINTTIDLANFELYPDQINFSSNYNITPNDFYILNQEKTYSIISSVFLGYLFRVKFSLNYNVALIDEIFLNGINLNIQNVDNINSYVELLIPDSTPSVNDVFEFRNQEFVKSYSTINNKVYLEFVNPVFPYVLNKTFILIEDKNYYLYIDEDGKYYINLAGFSNFTDYDIIVINQLTCEELTPLNQVLYEYKLDPPIYDTDYRPINDNYIVPLEFSILNQNTSSPNKKIQPLHVHTFGDNKVVFHYTYAQNLILVDKAETFTKVSHKKRIVEDLSNQIVSITKQEEFLYYTNVKYPVCVNTTAFVYKNIMDGPPSSQVYDIIPWEGITEPRFNIENKTSIYFNQENDSTYFSIKTQYMAQELKNNVGFIQKNTWDITQTDYSIANNSLVITMPDDFVLILLQNKSFYKINNFQIQNSDISTYDNKLVIKWNPLNGVLTETITLKQYFIESIGTVFKPLENRKYIVKIKYPYQYLPTTNLYMYQYDGFGTKFDNYLYLIETTEPSPGPNGYFQEIVPQSTIQLITNNTTFTVKILDKVRENNKICYVVSCFEKLNTTQPYLYHFNNFKMNVVTSIRFYQNSLQFAKFYFQTELDTLNVFMNDSVNDFKILDGFTTISNPLKFYLVSYEKSELTNLFYSNEFKQNINMNKIVEYNQNVITTNIVPKFSDYSKFFSSIKLYFNDQLVEELSENTFLIDKYLYSTDETRNQKNKMCEIRFDGKKWYFYLPLNFWYSCKPGLSIPTVAMPNTQIRLKYTLNDVAYTLTNILTNTSDTTFTFTNKPTVNLSLITDYMLLDNSERKLFGNNAHEYIIDRYKIYPDTYITSEESVVKCNFKGLVKDIHLISRPSSNSKLTYYPIINTKYDAKYDTYVKAYYFYLDLLAYGKYRTDEQRNYAVDIEQIKTNEIKYALYKMSTNKTSADFFQIYRLTEWFSTWSIWSEDLLKYLMYYETKYLYEITDYKRKEYLIAMYLKYQFSNEYETQTISPIDSLLFKANGSSLFAERDYTYFTDVVPYQKFKNSLPNGHYAYTFSLHPTEDQHSGHLNFSNFDDVVMRVKSNSKVKSDPYSLSTVVKEYNILRFMSGHSSLAWL